MTIRPHRLCIPLLAALLALQPGTADPAPPPWPEASFTYLAARERLPKVLSAFGQAFGLQVHTTTAVDTEDTRVDGRLTAPTPSDFLNQLGASYGLTWYYRGGAIHVSRTSESITRALSTGGASGTLLRTALSDLGVLDAKFGWGELPDRGAVLVSGPPSYISLIEQTLDALPPTPLGQQIKVFRLQHAAVDDRTIQYRDKQIITAGVATILRNLIAGVSGPSGTTIQTVELAAPLRNALTPLATTETEESRPPAEAARPDAPRPAAGGAGIAPVIQADSRLNAVVIKDRPENMAIYEQLIAILDVPSQLIEIEAMIVDVNTTKVSELGIDWTGRVGNTAFSFGQPAQAPSGTSFNIVRGTGVDPTTVIADAGNFLMSRIAALQSDGDATIVSQPSVLTVDNMGALIDLSETFYVQSTGERVAQVTPISVGVTLRVTPHLITHGSNRAVQLTVDIEDGAIQDLQIQNLPTVRRSTIGTQAVVAEQSSLVIGGFNTERNVQQGDAVPVLGEVPVLGLFFSKKKTDVQRRERLFLITPRVVPSPVFAQAAR